MRPEGQAGELQVGLPDLARQGHTLLQVPFGVLESPRPDLGDTQADEHRGAQILAQPEVHGIGSLREGEQSLRLLDHDRDVDEAPGQKQPQHG